MRLDLSLQWALAAPRRGLPERSVLRRAVHGALENRPREIATITVRFVAAEEGRRINQQFRQLDHATDVLSFGYAPWPHLAGDLLICLPVVELACCQRGLPLESHLIHLLVHGCLHLQGWDHENEQDAQQMEAEETRLLRVLGLPDPHAPGAA